jgi:hypothetical protein
MACVLPIMYGLEVWYGKRTDTLIKKFQGVQNRASHRILGAVGTTAISVLHAKAGVMPLKERFRLLAEKGGLRLNY